MMNTNIAAAGAGAGIVDIHTNGTGTVARNNHMSVIIDPHIDTSKAADINLDIALVTHIHRRNVKPAKTEHTTATTHQHKVGTVSRALDGAAVKASINKHTMVSKQPGIEMLLHPSAGRPVMQDAEVNAVLELLNQHAIIQACLPLVTPFLTQAETHSLSLQKISLVHNTKNKITTSSSMPRLGRG